MQEITFRATPKENTDFPKGIYGVLGIHWGVNIIDLDCENGDALDLDKFDLWQYIGFHDKHGKQIYEDDIVQYKIIISNPHYGGSEKTGDLVRAKVVFIEHISAFGLERINIDLRKSWTSFDFARFYGMNDFEVIGSNYENPELLKEK